MEKIALVTGCSSGIGRATSLKLAREGFYTFATMRDLSKGESLKQVASNENLPLELMELDVSKSNIKVQIEDINKFWLAENYHQDFAYRNQLKYIFYRNTCGRDKRLDEVWGQRARTGMKWQESSG